MVNYVTYNFGLPFIAPLMASGRFLIAPLSAAAAVRSFFRMTGYTKLFGTILDSTIWRESKETKILWITMLAMAGKEGIVESSIPGLADRAKLTISETETSLASLMKPDPYSRTKDFEGRRVETIDGGWRILNHDKYREKMSADERAEYQRRYMAEYRAAGKDKTRGKLLVNSGKQMLARLGHPEADASFIPPLSTSGGVGEIVSQPTAPSETILSLPAKLNTSRMQNKWQVWQTVRRGLKKPKSWLTLFNTQLEWLSNFDEATAFEILSASIRNGWQGLFEPKQNYGNKAHHENPRNIGVTIGPTDYAAAAKRKAERDGAEAEERMARQMAEDEARSCADQCTPERSVELLRSLRQAAK